MFFYLWKCIAAESMYVQNLTSMAEIQQPTNCKKSGGTRSKKLSTRVDLTPMVDLGFLLITFFIFTTALNEPKAMRMYLPNEKASTLPPEIPRNKVLTLLPGIDNKIFYYYGDNPVDMQVTGFNSEGIRKIILNKKQSIAQQYGNAQELVVLIKPSDNATYQNVVDILDEMLINNVHRYMLLELDEKEKKFIAIR